MHFDYLPVSVGHLRGSFYRKPDDPNTDLYGKQSTLFQLRENEDKYSRGRHKILRLRLSRRKPQTSPTLKLPPS
jgi:hypothetical protein